MSVNNFRLVICTVFVFLLSYVLLQYYVSGDQAYYHSFYEAIPEYGFKDGFIYYTSALGSMEPMYYVLTYFFSGLVDKDILMSFINSLFYLLLIRLLVRNKVSFPIICLLLFNFYLMVLLFAAERLKVAIFFMLFALSFSGSLRYWFLGLSLISHVQVVFLIAGKLIASFVDYAKPLLNGKLKYGAISTFGAAIIVFLVMYLLRDHIFSKFEAYSSLGESGGSYSGGFSAMLKPLIFLLFSLYYARQKKLEVFSMHFPLLVAAFLIGEERIVIFSYFVFMYYALQVNRGENLGVIVFSFYFLVKGIYFIGKIYTYGNGFYGA